MKVRCPACGATMSLEVLIAHQDAREALISLAKVSQEPLIALLRYLTLFRPSEKDLSFNRVSKLLGELIPMIQAGEITRNRTIYPAPREAWVWAAERCVEARNAGRLKTPLTSHGFLLENITFWTPEKTAVRSTATDGIAAVGHYHPPEPQSKLRGGVGDLMEWANEEGE
ncbi:hypothetical protein GJV52_05500 [Neisseria brasiliensis]|uniref:hypothetical protein n=1 Tax=Neisseria TaxID=482 RepID=UPI000C27CDE4|nr:MULTISPECIES: hypothetical protein [Neisseria]PJO78220.1 hypothetical protein CWC45_06225 [Neisseria sp. N177_16]QGL25032.1 hypothetical protein GJV52_05500 [Neisseria brasiliensis]